MIPKVFPFSFKSDQFYSCQMLVGYERDHEGKGE